MLKRWALIGGLLFPALLNAAPSFVGAATSGLSGFPSSLSMTYTATGGPGSILMFNSGKYFYPSSLTNTTWKVGGVTTSFVFQTSTAGHSATGSFGYLVLPSSGLGTLTFTPPEGTNLTGLLLEYSGVDTSSPIGAVSVNAPPDGMENLDPGNLTITTLTAGSIIVAATFGVQQTNPVTSTYAPGGGGSTLRANLTAASANNNPTGGAGDYNAPTPGLYNVGFNFGGLGGNGNVFVAVELKAAPVATVTTGPRTPYVFDLNKPYGITQWWRQ